MDEPRFHRHLTGRDNLRLLAAARGGRRPAIGPSLARVGLAERADDKVGSYSMGMRQRLGVASCLLGDPELLILDEPMNGLDPAGMHEMRAMIASLVGEGRTIMLSSHLLDEVERTATRWRSSTRAGRPPGPHRRTGPRRGQPRRPARLRRPGGRGPAHRGGRDAAGVTLGEPGLTVTLPAGASRETVAEVNRRLVAGGISVYSLQEVRASLEDWFLSVTTRLGEQA